MAGHAQLKFVMMECSKKQIRLTGLILYKNWEVFKINLYLSLVFRINFHMSSIMLIIKRYNRIVHVTNI